jgi:poly-gamma-glutamate synthase PgsB/CapB
MTGTDVLVVLTLVLTVAGIVELGVHRRRLGRIGVRIHVNGTRGKSSVVRLIAAGLRAAGKVVCAKTTGSAARFILPDGRELPIYRPAGANVIEQRRIVAVAAAEGAEVLVVECMALQPRLQALSEDKLIRATIGVITNARPDHLEIMGPRARDVARALAATTPLGGKLFTTEREHLGVFAQAAADRGTELCVVAPDEDVAGQLGRFSYTEHADNVALALAVCESLGVARALALAGMTAARPDPGAMTERRLDFFGRQIVFVNGFAANDPVSTRQLWDLVCARHERMTRRIAVFNLRADRPDRSIQLGREFAAWPGADRVVLMGSGTLLFARAATGAGLSDAKLVLAEGLGVQEVFERIVGLAGKSSLVMGMGNIGGGGLELAAYFANRAAPEES